MGKITPLGRNHFRTAELCTVLVALVLSGVSCSYLRRSQTSKKAPSPPVENKDPIISMVMASSIDAKGQLAQPRRKKLSTPAG